LKQGADVSASFSVYRKSTSELLGRKRAEGFAGSLLDTLHCKQITRKEKIDMQPPGKVES